jgi:hypothetical protein
MNEFYDVVDSEGNVIETAAQQEAAAKTGVEELPGITIDHDKKKITLGDIKKLNKLYTTVQHPRVKACMHRLDLSRQPRHRNCETCWFAFFQNHGEVVQQLDEMHNLGKTDEIIMLQGIKFYKMWRRFMATVAQWQQVVGMNENTNSNDSASEVVG